MRLGRAIALLAWLLAGLVSTAGPAAAHASLVGSMPQDGGAVSPSPPVAGLHFSEPVRPLVMRLTAPDGTAADLSPRARGETVEVPLPPLQDGGYLLSWRVVSADGHPVAGTIAFSVGAAAVGAPRAAASADGDLRAVTWAARVLLYAGLLFGVGLAFSGAWLLAGGTRSLARPLRRDAFVALALGTAGAVAGLGLSGLDLLGLGWLGLASSAPWSAAAGTSLGLSTLLALAAFAVAALALRAGDGRVPATLSVFLAAAALAATGHAATAPPQWLARPAVAAHAACALMWAGALPLLGWLAWTGDRALATALRRFSILAVAGVALLAVAGGTLAAIQLREVSELVDTPYGRLLAAKLAAVLALLALAAWNRRVLTPRIASGDRAATRGLARTVSAELVVMLAIAGLVAGWRFTPPPRALAAAQVQGTRVHVHGARAMADVALLPGGRASTRADIVVLGPDFDTLAAKEVTLILANPGAGIEPIERKATLLPDGRWQVGGLSLPVAGRWSIRIDVLIDDFDKVMLEDGFALER